MSKIEKNDLMVYFIRHGKTEGNSRQCYIGSTDEPLLESGIEEIRAKINAGYYPEDHFRAVYVSPMLRCRTTADLIFPDMEKRIVRDLREMDFGELEGKNWMDLEHHKAYQDWLNSGGTLPFPSGESMNEFEDRCEKALKESLLEVSHQGGKTAVFVVHGGTIMALMHRLGGMDFYELQIKNGECVRCKWDGLKLSLLT